MLQAADLTIRLHPADDVVIARLEVPSGTLLAKENVRAIVTIPAGHKIAVRPIAKGQPAHRYNQIIGFATRDIAAGDHVHVHNLAMGDFQRDYAFASLKTQTQYFSDQARFQGIVRADGRVATRNHIGILTSVNCSATVARMIARHFENRLDDYPNVDGVVAHEYWHNLDTTLVASPSVTVRSPPARCASPKSVSTTRSAPTTTFSGLRSQ